MENEKRLPNKQANKHRCVINIMVMFWLFIKVAIGILKPLYMYRLRKSDGTSNYIYQICQTTILVRVIADVSNFFVSAWYLEKQIERNFKQQNYHQQYKVYKQVEMAEIVDRLLPSGVKWYRLSFVSTWFNCYCDSSK